MRNLTHDEIVGQAITSLEEYGITNITRADAGNGTITLTGFFADLLCTVEISAGGFCRVWKGQKYITNLELSYNVGKTLTHERHIGLLGY